MALRLRQRGLPRVRPLAGGLEAWRQRGYPLARPGSTADAKKIPDGREPIRVSTE